MKETKLSPLASLAFGFILTGILFAENRLLGYSLTRLGVLLAVVDPFMNRNRTI